MIVGFWQYTEIRGPAQDQLFIELGRKEGKEGRKKERKQERNKKQKTE